MPVPPIPPGYGRVTPYLIAQDVKRALAWYAEAFGAEETMRIPGPNDTVMHAEFRIGDSVVMIGEQSPEYGAYAPPHYGGTAVSFVHYVEDADIAFSRAVAAGAKAERPVADQPYGDRMGTVTDPFGHRWHIATHVEDVSPEEMIRRMSGG
ncbi:glyoxalase [Falsiroseomonas bella]|uniref:Glyoxalase n=1 Tax=Falsiroseomonas bella TaxID=2184016 RepID=A0A317FP15_9PROT|nr:VOC family protein [Falsiroseomonas bella]PWS39366.1 glyoxalase [Falsiroseomonas bella]